MESNSMSKKSGLGALLVLLGLATLVPNFLYGTPYMEILRRYEHNGKQYDDALDAYIKEHINDTDDNGQTLLHFATLFDNSQLAHKLLEMGAQANTVDKSSGLTPLTLAARHGNIKLVNALIAAQANPSGTIQRQSPLQTALNYAHPEVALALIKAGADIEREDSMLKTTVLMDLVNGRYDIERHDRLTILRALLDKQVDVNKRDAFENNALRYAQDKKDIDPEIVAMLKDAGAVASETEHEKRTREMNEKFERDATRATAQLISAACFIGIGALLMWRS